MESEKTHSSDKQKGSVSEVFERDLSTIKEKHACGPKKRERIISDSDVKQPRKKKQDADLRSIDDDDEETSGEDNLIQSEDENVTSEDPYKLHFEFKLPENTVNKYPETCLKKKKDLWPALGEFYITDFPSDHPVPPVPLVKKSSLQDFHFKKNLIDSCQSSNLLTDVGGLDSLQLEFFSVISTYRDIFFSNRTDANGQNLRIIYCLHALNHILKAKAKIIHHNSKVSKNPDEEYRDQGFTRPLVLMLVPFREDCYQIVNILSMLLTRNVLKKDRFKEAYFKNDLEKPRKRQKPDDFEKIFAGNTDEDFKIGLKIKNKSITLFADFYSAELIIASPVGIQQIVGGEGDKKRDFDFLSSIEMFILDRADIFMMQNWYHVVNIVKLLNLIPKEAHACDMFRVRMYALDKLSEFYRQTIFLSSVEHEWFRMFFDRRCRNHAGCLRTCSKVVSPAISQVVVAVPHVFLWFETSSAVQEMEDRFNFFITKLLPQFRKNPKRHKPLLNKILVYIPYYYEFVRLQQYFRTHDVSSVMLCEYTHPGTIAESRNWFNQGERQFMLYSERLHFYYRYRIKGVQHIIFYRLPTYAHFYSEICNLLIDADPAIEMTCSVIASKCDAYQVKHIVGLDKTIHMMNSDKKMFAI